MEDVICKDSWFCKQLIKLIGSERKIDLLWHWPSRYDIVPEIDDFSKIKKGTRVTVRVVIGARSLDGKLVEIFDKHKNKAFLRFFQTNKLANNFKYGSQIVISGNADIFSQAIYFVHPEHYFKPYDPDIKLVSGVVPVYPLTQGLKNLLLRKNILAVLKRLSFPAEWLTEDLRQNWLGFKEALDVIHNPNALNYNELKVSLAKERLIFDEIIAEQIAILNNHNKNDLGLAQPSGFNRKSLNLPFALTEGQKKIIETIDKKMAVEKRLNLLVQGDVGSGKTILALHAALNSVDNKKQVAMMVPSTVLAEQHFRTFSKICPNLRILLVTSKVRKRSKDFDIAIGTQALLNLEFNELGLTIIDEQHRFGVKQRFSLIQKNILADHLSLSATPIPRSLLLTMLGEVEVMQLTEKPFANTNLVTSVLPSSQKNAIAENLAKLLMTTDSKAFWVCPAIESEDYVNCQEITKLFPKDFPLLILHGGFSEKEKGAILDSFRYQDFKLLIATTVIEVGVDIPQADIIIIDQADLFGLATLHQLRGRVGRHGRPAKAILLYQKLSPLTKQRLNIIRNLNDGFKIAEQDLVLRGAGDILGKAQSGERNFKLSDGIHPLFERARSIAEKSTAQTKEFLLFAFDRKLELLQS